MQRATRVPISGVHSPVYHVNDTSSTLDLAAALLADTTTATPHLTTIIADHQSAGRGRLGRTWTTPDGQALLASTIVSLPTSFPTEMLGWLVHACALSVRDALSPRLSPLGHTVSLKWPNDVLLDGRKICGILCERVDGLAVLGWGVNISMDETELPVPGAGSLLLAGLPHGKDELTAAILTSLQRWFEQWQTTGQVREGFMAACDTIGRSVLIHEDVDSADSAVVAGTAVGVDDTGALVVEDADGHRRVHSAGDVIHLR